MTTNRITARSATLLKNVRLTVKITRAFLRALHHGLKKTHSQGLFNTQIQDK